MYRFLTNMLISPRPQAAQVLRRFDHHQKDKYHDIRPRMDDLYIPLSEDERNFPAAWLIWQLDD